MNLVLTYFDSKIGPKVFLSLPNDISPKISNSILKIMNLEVEEGFLEVSIVEEQVKVINYLFEVESDWARGKRDMIMLSVVVDKNYKTEIFHDIMMNVVESIKGIEDCFKGFYKDNETHRDDPNIDEILSKMKRIVLNGRDDFKNALENPNLGIFLVLGLSGVGKTSILESLKNNLFKKDVKPTLALNVLEMILDNNLFKMVDVSGQKMLRNQWWTYTKRPDAIIFVLDANDTPARLIESKFEFDKLMTRFTESEKYQLSNTIPLLLCINKIDLIKNPDAKKDEIIKILNPDGYDINYHIELTSAATGTGLKEGFKWIFQQLLKIA